MRGLMTVLVAAGFLCADVSWALVEQSKVTPVPEADHILAQRRRKKRQKRIKKKTVVPRIQRGRTYIEITEAMDVVGQKTQPGEVRILERKKIELNSLVKRRQGFQKEIIQTVFPAH